MSSPSSHSAPHSQKGEGCSGLGAEGRHSSWQVLQPYKLEKLLGTRGTCTVGGGDPKGHGAETFLCAPSQPCFLGYSVPAALGALLSPMERQLPIELWATFPLLRGGFPPPSTCSRSLSWSLLEPYPRPWQ